MSPERPRPKILPSIHELGTGQEAAAPEPAPRPPERELLDDVAAELELERAAAAEKAAAERRKRRPKHNSGSSGDPYPCADGRLTVKTSFNFTEDFARELLIFAAQHLPPRGKSAWAERVLKREIARTRKRAAEKGSG